MIRCVRREIRYKTMAHILIGKRALCFVIELVLRKIDEGSEVPIVNTLGIGVVGIQIEILAQPLDGLQGQAMVIGGDHAVVEIKKTGAQNRSAKSSREFRAGEMRFAEEQIGSALTGRVAPIGIEPSLRIGRITWLCHSDGTGNVQGISSNQAMRPQDRVP